MANMLHTWHEKHLKDFDGIVRTVLPNSHEQNRPNRDTESRTT